MTNLTKTFEPYSRIILELWMVLADNHTFFPGGLPPKASLLTAFFGPARTFDHKARKTYHTIGKEYPTNMGSMEDQVMFMATLLARKDGMPVIVEFILNHVKLPGDQVSYAVVTHVKDPELDAQLYINLGKFSTQSHTILEHHAMVNLLRTNPERIIENLSAKTEIIREPDTAILVDYTSDQVVVDTLFLHGALLISDTADDILEFNPETQVQETHGDNQ